MNANNFTSFTILGNSSISDVGVQAKIINVYTSAVKKYIMRTMSGLASFKKLQKQPFSPNFGTCKGCE
jgi:hypothetical protein